MGLYQRTDGTRGGQLGTTDNYVNRFGYKLMVEYNSKLLHNDSKTSLLAALQALSADERESLLAMVGGR